jgi:hypothetical protein
MKLLKNLFLSLYLSCTVLFLSCGGGVDVGNPQTFMISGYVSTPETKGSLDVKVIIGRCDDYIPEISQEIVDRSGIVLLLSHRRFDTTICNANGYYSFSSVNSGTYSVVAEGLGKRGYAKLSVVNSDIHDPSQTSITLKQPSKLDVIPYNTYDTSKKHFIRAEIAGTPYTVLPDSNGICHFDSIPSGMLDITMYRNDKIIYKFEDLSVLQSSTPKLYVHSLKAPEFWVAKGTGYISYDSRPFIKSYDTLSVNQVAAISNVNTGNYHIALNFSHAMDAASVISALHISAKDTTIRIDTLRWLGGNRLELKFCINDSLGICSPQKLIAAKPWILKVDTTARSLYGLNFVIPEEITIP